MPSANGSAWQTVLFGAQTQQTVYFLQKHFWDFVRNGVVDSMTCIRVKVEHSTVGTLQCRLPRRNRQGATICFLWSGVIGALHAAHQNRRQQAVLWHGARGGNRTT